jgi:integrase
MTLDEVKDRFIREAREGVALNKWRRPYRPRSVEDLESLNQLPLEMRRRDLDAVSPGEVQALVDELTRRHLSASRIRSVVSALRALYRFARERELATHDPAQEVRLPLDQRVVERRVVAPAEFARLLGDLWKQTTEEIDVGKERAPRDALNDALPYALTAYGTARAQEIEVLDWRHVDLRLGGAELAGDEEGRKPGGSWRIVPLVAPLRVLLREEWLAQGKPKRGKVCPPQRIRTSGRRSMRGVQRRVRKRWQAHGLEPIGLQDARHTAATWLDHAGVSPKVCSQIMGHKDARVSAGGGSDHPAALYPHPPGRVGARPGATRQVHR